MPNEASSVITDCKYYRNMSFGSVTFGKSNLNLAFENCLEQNFPFCVSDYSLQAKKQKD